MFEWRNGSRPSMRCWCPKGRGGSTPLSNTYKKMKVLFLDIDGVLNTGNLIFVHGNKAVGEGQLSLLQSIIFTTKAEIVLSSTWRLYNSHRTVLIERFKEKNLTILDSTKEIRGEFSEFIPRSIEIEEWLDRHPEVTNFAILDDGDDAEIKGHFFETNFQDGLTAEIAQKVIEYLNRG